MPRIRKQQPAWLIKHSLTIVAITLLLVWIAGYVILGPRSHLGAFFGNAIADWSGSVVIILGTKVFYEVGSDESKPVRGRKQNPLHEFVHEHSLLLFIIITGLGWTALYLHMSPNGKWGQVVGNIVSEWGQMAGLVFLTKRLVEIGSKE